MSGARWVTWAACIVWAVSASMPDVATAHHVVSDSGIAWVEPLSVMDVELSAASFDLGEGRRGSWQTMAVTGQFTLGPRLSWNVRAPWAFVQFDDGRKVLGLGDMEFGAKGLLYATEHGAFILSAGLGVEVPTGEARVELGSGHVEVSPYIAWAPQCAPRHLRFALVSGRRAITRAPAPAPQELGERIAHGSVLGPHGSAEIFGRLGVAFVEPERYYISTGVDAVGMAEGPSRGPLVWRGEVGWNVSDRVRIAAGVDRHLAGEARFGMKGRVNTAVFF
ncbi:MAG: hypothetical protein AAGI01_01715 [Myxococcota bacterium]